MNGVSRACRLSLVLVLIAGEGACNALGHSVADGLNDRRAELAQTARPVVRAAVEEGGRAFTDSVRPRVEVAVGRLSDSARATVSGLLDTVRAHAAQLGDSLTGTGRRAVVEYLALARDSGGATVDRWVSHATGIVQRRLTVALTSALDSIAGGLDPRGPVGSALVRLSDRVVRQAIEAIRDETQRPTPWWVWAAAVLITLSLLAVIGSFVLQWYRQYRARDETVRLMSRAIQERGDSALAQRVKELAVQRGVEPWLHEYLDRQRLLVAGRTTS